MGFFLYSRLKVCALRRFIQICAPVSKYKCLEAICRWSHRFHLGLSANWLSENVLPSRWRILDDLLLGVAAGFIVLWYERLRTRALLQRLVIIREMNHHVRNALQVVIYAAAAHKDDDLAEQVREAVRRIDWALKEVLPELKEKPTKDV